MQEPRSPKLQQMGALGIARIAAKGLQSKQGWQQSLAYRLITACLDEYIPASGGHSSHCLSLPAWTQTCLPQVGMVGFSLFVQHHSGAADEPHMCLHGICHTLYSPDYPALALPAFKFQLS